MFNKRLTPIQSQLAFLGIFGSSKWSEAGNIFSSAFLLLVSNGQN